ncbi:unnamed protein product [Strongylus vulgaris]|uniref:SCP domain-containing protein n=1 Tax=Strongylus vulgaris TaxID=40348 RepID=A0A3P7LUS2_STRVU|nr:unnamed protein product [Strongylus vulgaris]
MNTLQKWWNQATKVELSSNVNYNEDTIKEFGMMANSKTTAIACTYGKCTDGSNKLLCVYNQKPDIGGDLYSTVQTIQDTCSDCPDQCYAYLCRRDPAATSASEIPLSMCSSGSDEMDYYLQKMARDMHNHYRRLVATGWAKDNQGYAPPAKAMQQLSYDCDTIGESSKSKADCDLNSYTADTDFSINYFIYDKVSKEEALQKILVSR